MTKTASPKIDSSAADEVFLIALVHRMCGDGTARRLRTEHQLSLRSVGTTCGADAAMVLRWETGVAMPRGERALAYGAFLARLLDLEEAK